MSRCGSNLQSSIKIKNQKSNTHPAQAATTTRMTEEDHKDPEAGGKTEDASPPLKKKDQGDESKRSSENVSESVRAQVETAMGGELKGLSLAEAEASLAKFGYNEVVIKEAPIILQILSRYLGIVPLFVTLTAVLSAAILSTCTDNPE
jgi:hypothetical protein